MDKKEEEENEEEEEEISPSPPKSNTWICHFRSGMERWRSWQCGGRSPLPSSSLMALGKQDTIIEDDSTGGGPLSPMLPAPWSRMDRSSAGCSTIGELENRPKGGQIWALELQEWQQQQAEVRRGNRGRD